MIYPSDLQSANVIPNVLALSVRQREILCSLQHTLESVQFPPPDFLAVCS
jgi:hypothetical protein